MLTVKSSNSADPYGALVETFYVNEFPGTNSTDSNAILDAVTTAIIASNQIRFGPAPGPENLVQIRQVVRMAIADGRPVPILTPFGSKKSKNGESVDVAEVATLRQICSLQRRVTNHYKPGILVNMRIEDTSGYYLFADEGEAARTSTTHYVRDFQTLVRVMGYSPFIRPVLESSLFSETDYTAAADAIVPAMMTYLTSTDAHGFDNYQERQEWRTLKQHGWKGVIPKEQRDYYRERYRRLYPGISDHEATMRLARYLAGSLARIQLNGTGSDPSWGNDYLRVTFVNPVPGAPRGITDKNVYYRTLPLKFAATHNPAWRTKGYLKINGTVVPKIASWHEQLNFTPLSVIFTNGLETVSVKSDYVICD